MASSSRSFSSLAAVDRAAALVDRASLAEMVHDGNTRTTLWTGSGRLGGRSVLLALTDGHQRGGTIGIAEARQLSELVTLAAARRFAAVVICWDTGGVRVQEGPLALAAAAAVGVALARLSLTRTRIFSVISGPRGCFGAPAVMVATSHRTLMTPQGRWGLTGPMLLRSVGATAPESRAAEVSSAHQRVDRGHASSLVSDSAAAIRRSLLRVLATPPRRVPPARVLRQATLRTASLLEDLAGARGTTEDPPDGRGVRRPRDLLQYSFRGRWKPIGPALRQGHVHASWGAFDRRPAMGIIVGSERSRDGIGIADADIVARMAKLATRNSDREPAAIVIFLFCRGHSDDLLEEGAGLPCALAQCLRSLVAARLAGHPLLCVLGGGAYGAAYLSLAAPCHRILAVRGTRVAPMAPRVLEAFQQMRGIGQAPRIADGLASFVPEIRIVDSVVRLPRAVSDELRAARRTARIEAASSPKTFLVA